MPPVSDYTISQGDEQRPRKRVRAACNRCRRQKLKCDTQRPCALCIRSSIKCVTDGRDHGRKSDGERTIPATSRAVVSTTSPARNKEPHHVWRSTSPGQLSAMEDTHQHHDTVVPSQNYPRDTSSVKLTQEILQQLSPDASLCTDTSALPGGSRRNTAVSPLAIPISRILGVTLPPKAVRDALVDTYFESVHWFMVLFYEPQFRQRYEFISSTEYASPGDLPFLVCLMLVFAIGARYTDPHSDASPEAVRETDLEALQTSLLQTVRAHLFDVIELGGLEVVQICVLLSSFYIYHDQPNLAFAIHGMGVKGAHSIYLHQEATWKDISDLAREVKRRVWWALYVVDCFYSILLGRPRSIRDEESQVSMVQNFEDTAARHPAFNSTETIGGVSYPVTIFSYQRFKFALYRIAARVMREIYFGNSSKSLALDVKTVRSISRDLKSWFDSLPPELKHSNVQLDPISRQERSLPNRKTERIFRLQALALQLAYDNIQILLHRPLLQLPTGLHNSSHPPQSTGCTNSPSANKGAVDESELSAADSETLAASRAQCWESAIRTSNLNLSVVKETRYTHAASYIGIQMFTAGMVLSLVALSAPLSPQAQQAKRCIGQIVSTSASIGKKTLLSTQSQQVLRQLVRLILEKEMTSIFMEPIARQQAQRLDRASSQCPRPPTPRISASPLPAGNHEHTHQRVMDKYDGGADGLAAPVSAVDGQLQQDELGRGIWSSFPPAVSLDAGSSVDQGFPTSEDWPLDPSFSFLGESQDANSDLARQVSFMGDGSGLKGAGQAWLWGDL